jgi:hypothetical protein
VIDIVDTEAEAAVWFIGAGVKKVEPLTSSTVGDVTYSISTDNEGDWYGAETHSHGGWETRTFAIEDEALKWFEAQSALGISKNNHQIVWDVAGTRLAVWPEDGTEACMLWRVAQGDRVSQPVRGYAEASDWMRARRRVILAVANIDVEYKAENAEDLNKLTSGEIQAGNGLSKDPSVLTQLEKKYNNHCEAELWLSEQQHLLAAIKQIQSVTDAQIECGHLTVLYRLPGSLIGLSARDIAERDVAWKERLGLWLTLEVTLSKFDNVKLVRVD